MLNKKFKFEKLNKIISISILIGGCLIFGVSEEFSATGFKGVNNSSLGARPRTTNINFIGSGNSGGISGCSLLGQTFKNTKKERNALINTIVNNLPSKTGDSNNSGLYNMLLEHNPNSVKNKPSGLQERIYVNSENGNKVKIMLDGKIISSTVEANGKKYHTNFKEGWFQETEADN